METLITKLQAVSTLAYTWSWHWLSPTWTLCQSRHGFQSKPQLWITHQVKLFSLLSDFNDIYLSPDKFSRNARLCVFTYNTVISDSSMSFSSEVKVTLSKVLFCSTPSQSSGTNPGVYFHHRFTAMLRSYERTWWNLNSEEKRFSHWNSRISNSN